MIDSHCHLDFEVFSSDREQVIANAKDKGIKRFHVPGTIAEKWNALIEFGHRADIDVSLGLHPYFLSQHPRDELLAQLRRLNATLEQQGTDIFAVGECGLDASINVDMQLQIEIFKSQVDIAHKFRKPLIVHSRKTHHLIIQSLNDCQFKGRGIIHAFSGSVESAKSYIDRGWLLGVGGTITYPRGHKTLSTFKSIGLENLVLETDSPDMPLLGHQGRRNEPQNLLLIAQKLAESFNVELDRVIESTSRNYLSLAQ